MAARNGLRAVRELLLAAYVQGIIDDIEYAILCDLNSSRKVYPYWGFNPFDLDEWDDTRSRTELRFSKVDLPRLLNVLQIPDKIVTVQGTVCTGMEGLCILLKRLAYPCRFTDMVSAFGRNPTEICLIFHQVLDHVYNFHCFRLQFQGIAKFVCFFKRKF